MPKISDGILKTSYISIKDIRSKAQSNFTKMKSDIGNLSLGVFSDALFLLT